MSPSTAEVLLRNHSLATDAPIIDTKGPGGATQFVRLSAPPPVRTLITVSGKLVEVTHVVESEGGEPAGPGVFVRKAPKGSKQLLETLGTEHLEPVRAEASAWEEGSDEGPTEDPTQTTVSGIAAEQPSGYAVPAPVVEPEPSAPISVEPGAPTADASPRDTSKMFAPPAPEASPQPEAQAEAEAAPEPEPEPEPEASAQPEPAPEPSAAPADSGKTGKRRKGRKRS